MHDKQLSWWSCNPPILPFCLLILSLWNILSSQAKITMNLRRNLIFPVPSTKYIQLQIPKSDSSLSTNPNAIEFALYAKICTAHWFLIHFMHFAAACVAVSAWTLVAISVERYYGICHPLRSRWWQTLSHSYKAIAVIWLCSLVLMAPIAMFSKLIPTNQGKRFV